MKSISHTSRTDDNDLVIIDPQLATVSDYSRFITFYAITPWNNYYNINRQNETEDLSSSGEDTDAVHEEGDYGHDEN